MYKNKIYINETAPIIPNISLGDIPLNCSIKNIANKLEPIRTFDNWQKTKKINQLYKYRSVYIWTCNDIVEQLSAEEGYRGSFFKIIRINSTLKELSQFGNIYEDEEDNLMIHGIDGFMFDTGAWDGFNIESNYYTRITNMFIFNKDI